MKPKPGPTPSSGKKGPPIEDPLPIAQRFRRLLSAGVAIFSEHTTEGVLQRIVDIGRVVIGARYAALGVLAADRKSLVTFVTSGIDANLRKQIGDIPQGRGVLDLVMREARPIRSADVVRHPEAFGYPPHHPAMHSFLGVPINTGRSVFGNLYFTEKIGAREFDAEDEGIAVLLATQAAVAVENARLMEQNERLLEQMRDWQRQRDLFFSMMNHELRNALTGVYGWSQRLLRPRSADSLAQAAKEVYEGAERTISLLNNFLDLTRLDSGKVRPVWRDIDVEQAARRAITGFEPAAEAKHVVLETEPAGKIGSLRTDPVRLQQILVDLVSNAVRHSPEGSRVLVGIRPKGRIVDFVVRDEGPGIPADVQERIFEPFERLDPHAGVGSGLGLPVSRRLAEALGGTLTVASTPGRGAIFTLSLPQQSPAST